MEQIKIIFLLFSVVCIANTRGFNWTSTNPIFNSTCVDGSIIMAWDYTTDLGETVVLKEWKKLNGTGVIGVGDHDGSMLTAATGYENRLKLIGNAGLEINKTTLADAGTYYVLISTSSRTYTATATISVYVSPNSSCSPSDESIGKNLTCSIPYACPVKHDTKASWNINGQLYDYHYTCTYDDSGKTYKCCAEGNSTSTCSRDKLCIEHTCPAAMTTTTTTAITITTRTTIPTTTPITTRTDRGTTMTPSELPNEPIIIGASVGGFVLIILITIIICCCYHHKNGKKGKQYEADSEQNPAYGVSDLPTKHSTYDAGQNSTSITPL